MYLSSYDKEYLKFIVNLNEIVIANGIDMVHIF